MYGRVFLDEVAEELLAAGKIRYHSKEHQILRKVALDGAASLSLEDRQVYEKRLVPMIDRIDWTAPAPPAIRRLAANP